MILIHVYILSTTKPKLALKVTHIFFIKLNIARWASTWDLSRTTDLEQEFTTFSTSLASCINGLIVILQNRLLMHCKLPEKDKFSQISQAVTA